VTGPEHITVDHNGRQYDVYLYETSAHVFVNFERTMPFGRVIRTGRALYGTSPTRAKVIEIARARMEVGCGV
jgi:hypothetical protein